MKRIAEVMLGRRVQHNSPARSPRQDDPQWSPAPIPSEQEHQEALAILRQRREPKK